MKALVYGIAILGICGVIVTYIIGYNLFEGTVTENPYETGLKWDEANRQRSELGWSIEIENMSFKPGPNKLIFSIKDKKMNTMRADDIKILTTRPTTSRLDRTWMPQESKEGRYSVQIDFPVFGHWDIVFTVRKGDQVEMLKKSVYVNQ